MTPRGTTLFAHFLTSHLAKLNFLYLVGTKCVNKKFVIEMSRFYSDSNFS